MNSCVKKLPGVWAFLVSIDLSDYHWALLESIAIGDRLFQVTKRRHKQ